MPRDFFSGIFRGRAAPGARRQSLPIENPAVEFPCEEIYYDKFGSLQKIRHIRFHPLIVGIRGSQLASFDADTRDLTQVLSLQGARVSALDGKEFIVTGPHLGGPWVLRSGSNREALSWCQAFETAAELARQALREANQKSEANCPEDYKRKVTEVIQSVKSLAPASPPPSRAKLSALVCKACDCRFDEDDHIPALLQCHHTICQPCIQNLAVDGSVSCPFCSSSTELPDGKASHLPKNFAILDIKGPHHMRFCRNDTFHALDAAGGTCPICFDPLIEKVPLVLQCGHSLCDECAYGVAIRGKDNLLTCPECRTTSELTTRSVSVNYCLLQAVLEIIALNRESRTDARIAAQLRWTALRWAMVAVCALQALLKERRLREKAKAAKPKPKAAAPTAKHSATPTAKHSATPKPPPKKRSPPPKSSPLASTRTSAAGTVGSRVSSLSPTPKRPAVTTPRVPGKPAAAAAAAGVQRRPVSTSTGTSSTPRAKKPASFPP